MFKDILDKFFKLDFDQKTTVFLIVGGYLFVFFISVTLFLNLVLEFLKVVIK